jgi:hypothetical protein
MREHSTWTSKSNTALGAVGIWKLYKLSNEIYIIYWSTVSTVSAW